MQRKIIQQSASSLGISLPAKWAAKWRLKKGVAVEVSEEGNRLIVAASAAPAPRTARIRAEGHEGTTRRIFDALYKKGYDEVEISYARSEDLAPILKAIDDEAKTFEVIRQAKGTCIVRSISELDKEEFDNLLRRTMALLAEMMEGIAQALAQHDAAALTELVQLERTNNRFTHMMRRALNRSEYYDMRNSLLLYVIIEELEKAADELKRLCVSAASKELRPRKETIALAQQATMLMTLFMELFYAFSRERLLLVSDAHKRIVSAATALLERQGSDILAIVHIMNASRIVYELVGPVTAMQH